MTELLSTKRREFVSVSLLSALIVGFYFRFTTLLTRGHPTFETSQGPSDHLVYITLAETPAQCVNSHSCNRILKPFLADFLPGSLQTGFLSITAVSLVLSGVLVYLIAREFDFSKQAAVLGMLLFFTSNWAVKWFVFNFWITDSTSNVLFLAIVYSTLRERDLLFAAFLVLGVMTKETVILAAPVYYFYNVHGFVDRDLLIRWLVLLVPAVLVHFAIPLLTPAPFIESMLFSKVTTGGAKPIPPPMALLRNIVVNPYALLVILPLFGFGKSRRLVKIFGATFVLSYLQLLLIMNFSPVSAGRLLAVNTVVLVLLSLNGLETLAEEITGFVQGIDIQFYHFIPYAVLHILGNVVVVDSQYPMQTQTQIALFILYVGALVVYGKVISLVKQYLSNRKAQ